MSHPDDPVGAKGAGLPESAPESPPPSGGGGGGAGGEEMFSVIADVEKQLERMRAFQQDHEQQLVSLGDRLNALARKEKDLEQAARAVREQEAAIANQREAVANEAKSLGQAKEQIEKAKRQIDEQRQATEQQAAQLAARAAELESRQAQVKQKLAEAGAQEQQLAALKQEAGQRQEQFDLQTKELTQRVEKAEANVGDLIQQIERTREELESRAAELEKASSERESAAKAAEDLRSQLRQLTDQIGPLQAKAAEREQELAECHKKLEVAGRKLKEFAEVLGKQSPQLEKGAAAMAEVEAQRQQIQRLEKQLAERNLAGDPEEVRRKEQRITELTEALRQARGQTTGTPDVAKLQERMDQLNAELEQQRIERERGRVEIERLQSELANARAQAGGATSAEVKDLQRQVASLEQELGEARQAEGKAAAGQSGDLREKTQRLRAAAEHLRVRKARLQAVHRALRKRARQQQTAMHAKPVERPEELQARARQAEQLRQQGEQLRHVQEMLAKSESEMIRKWARPRAMTTLLRFVILSVVLAVASWFAADQFFPATVSAAVSLTADPMPGKELSPEEQAIWQEWHVALLSDASFQSNLAKRLAARGLVQFRDPQALASYLSESVQTDSTQPGRIVLSSSGTDPAEMTWLLDTVATTIALESNRQGAKRGLPARLQIDGERKLDGQYRYASLHPIAVDDQRLKFAGIILGSSMVLSLVLLIVIYGKLKRAKRLFEEDGGAVEDGTGEDDEPVVSIR